MPKWPRVTVLLTIPAVLHPLELRNPTHGRRYRLLTSNAQNSSRVDAWAKETSCTYRQQAVFAAPARMRCARIA